MPVDGAPAPEGWVRMRTIFGKSVVPQDQAEVIAKAVRRAVALRDVSPKARWMIVELWAANYLAETQATIDYIKSEADRYQREEEHAHRDAHEHL